MELMRYNKATNVQQVRARSVSWRRSCIGTWTGKQPYSARNEMKSNSTRVGATGKAQNQLKFGNERPGTGIEKCPMCDCGTRVIIMKAVPSQSTFWKPQNSGIEVRKTRINYPLTLLENCLMSWSLLLHM